MAHPLITANFRARVQSALDQAVEAAAVGHPGLVGEIREILIEEIIRPVLPPGVEAGTGKIVDHRGGVSDQVDIVIYDESCLPAWSYGRRGLGLYPVEAALYMIEVKSVVNRTQARDFAGKCEALRRLEYMPEYRARFVGRPVDRVIPCLFGYGSDLLGEPVDELRRVLDELTPPSDVLPVVMVVDRGYWFYSHAPLTSTGRAGWTRMRGADAVDDVVAWVAGVANTVPQMSVARQVLPFGNYIVADTTNGEPAWAAVPASSSGI